MSSVDPSSSSPSSNSLSPAATGTGGRAATPQSQLPQLQLPQQHQQQQYRHSQQQQQQQQQSPPLIAPKTTRPHRLTINADDFPGTGRPVLDLPNAVSPSTSTHLPDSVRAGVQTIADYITHLYSPGESIAAFELLCTTLPRWIVEGALGAAENAATATASPHPSSASLASPPMGGRLSAGIVVDSRGTMSRRQQSLQQSTSPVLPPPGIWSPQSPSLTSPRIHTAMSTHLQHAQPQQPGVIGDHRRALTPPMRPASMPVHSSTSSATLSQQRSPGATDAAWSGASGPWDTSQISPQRHYQHSHADAELETTTQQMENQPRSSGPLYNRFRSAAGLMPSVCKSPTAPANPVDGCVSTAEYLHTSSAVSGTRADSPIPTLCSTPSPSLPLSLYQPAASQNIMHSQQQQQRRHPGEPVVTQWDEAEGLFRKVSSDSMLAPPPPPHQRHVTEGLNARLREGDFNSTSSPRIPHRQPLTFERWRHASHDSALNLLQKRRSPSNGTTLETGVRSLTTESNIAVQRNAQQQHHHQHHAQNLDHGKACEKGKIPDAVDWALLEDVPSWLRSLRLHKYSELFHPEQHVDANVPKKKQWTWREMITLDEAQLEELGVCALGARRKLVKVFEMVREQLDAMKHQGGSADDRKNVGISDNDDSGHTDDNDTMNSGNDEQQD